MERKLVELIQSQSEFLGSEMIEPSMLVFEERVRLQCFHCSKYGVNWTCPPKIPDIDYRQLILEYDHTLLVYCRMSFTKENFTTVRRDSTNLVHRTLLEAEKRLWENNYPLAISFIGGSCKLCVQGCDPHRCRHPTLARIPIEATGVNVIKTAATVGLSIDFPPQDYLFRVGLLGW